MKIVSIHQPHFMPWLGYFDKIQRSDYFVFLDTVQFKKNEFQNRNK
ncbi:MAG: WbqC family protein, partial [Nitrospirae bacterium]|nr:WbqC family protein [Nitrospirota bacterium]